MMLMAPIRRIKFYHLLCQNHSHLWCFIDDNYMCLCTLERHANCFIFNSSMTYQCSSSEKHCLNDGLCYQDQHLCPFTKTCICNDCFFGPQCQFYAKGIGLTLNDILRYEILNNTRFFEQPITVKMSASITMIMFILGIFNGIFSYMTFRRKESQLVGCGLYLFASSIISIVIVILLTIQCWFLVFFQMNSIRNRTVLHYGCLTIEPLLKCLLYTNNWLTSCVSIQRTLTAYKNISFNKTKSKYWAKRIIFILSILVLITLVHEPMNRYIFDDIEEQRILCVIHHSELLKIYNSSIILIPFMINLFSAIFIIITTARHQNLVRKDKNYKQHLQKQFHEHKHMLISILSVLILSLPHLIISLISDCVRSSRNPWIFLFGYFVSFIPPVLMFFIFVLPSTLYKKQFKEAMICS